MQPPVSSDRDRSAASFGLPRQSRLRRRAEFLAVQKEGRSYRSRYVVAVVLPRNDLGIQRVGITVSKRVGKAVARNRVKRRLREVFRKNRHSLPPGLDLVLIARAGSAEAEFGELRDEVVGLFGRIYADPRFRALVSEEGEALP